MLLVEVEVETEEKMLVVEVEERLLEDEVVDLVGEEDEKEG